MTKTIAVRGLITQVEADAIGSSSTKVQSYPRLDIDEFSTSAKYRTRWSLYLRALAGIQKKEKLNEPFGYHRLAGIHGIPLQLWPYIKEAKQPEHIYCPHHTERFLPWHRVYLLAFEQGIVQEAKALAETDEEKVEAEMIRLPYWDYVKVNGHAPPQAVTQQKVTVTIGKNEVEIENPLHVYKFPKGAIEVRSHDTQTKRKPDTLIASEIEKLKLQEDLYSVLTVSNKFETLGSFKSIKANTLELIHNKIHGSVGGYMGYQIISAFDPIFWLHHTNIDRYYALWQGINPDAKYEAKSSSQLQPFHADEQGKEWTINMIQRDNSSQHNLTTFDRGYHYPETAPHQSKNTTVQKVLSKITELYGAELYGTDENGEYNQYPIGSQSLTSLAESSTSLASLLQNPEETRKATTLPASAAVRREWIVYFLVKKYIVESDFSLLIFLGDPGEEHERWSDSPNLVSWTNTLKADVKICANCRDQKENGTKMWGEFRITTPLLTRYPTLQLNDRTAVENILKATLTWRILRDDGTVYEPQIEEIGYNPREKELQVGVKSCIQAYPRRSDLSGHLNYNLQDVVGVTFDWVHHREVTEAQGARGGVVQKPV